MNILNKSLITGVVATTALALLAGCPSPDPKPVAKKPSWKQQSLSLTVDGFNFSGGRVKRGKWFGSGVFVAPGIIATNAHVAARAIKVTGIDDNNRPHIFSKILAIDVENDLALLKADYVSKDIKPAKIAAKPGNPKDLRQTPVLVVGNTGGMGLSTYEGKVTNVIKQGNIERVMHDGQTAGGSSGGPVFNMKTWELIAVNAGRLPKYRFSVAIPGWYVSKWLAIAGNTEGKRLASSFKISKNTKLMRSIKRQVCLMPGKSFVAPMTYSNGTDFLVGIQPLNNQPLVYGMLVQSSRGKALLDKGVVAKPTIRAFTTPISGRYNVIVGAPKSAQGKVCATILIGQIDWSKQINP